MKSNKFIALLAMAAVVASCSQEELVSVKNDAKVDLSARPVLGNVELGVADAATRMDIKDGSAINVKYETGDQIGAAIIDQLAVEETDTKTGYKKVGRDWKNDTWTYSEYVAGKIGANTEALYTQTKRTGADDGVANTAKDWYSTVEYISSNYPYTRDANGAWTTPANLVEGNYFFYMPYDAAYLNRASLKAVLPQIQDCSDAVMKETTWQGTAKVNSSSTAIEQLYKGTTEGFEKAMAVVGYKFLEDPKDGSVISPNVNMNILYAYPLITIKNNFNGFIYEKANGQSTAAAKATKTITVDSVQIYHDVVAAENKLFYTAAVKSESVVKVLAKDGEWNGKKLAAGAPTEQILDEERIVPDYPGHAEVQTARTKYSLYAQADFKSNHVTCVIDKEIPYGQSYSFHAVLPAANYGKKLKARIFATIDGKRVIITDATSTPHDGNDEVAGVQPDYYTVTTPSTKDYTFYDNVNGGMDCELVRAEQFPKAEIREDGKGIKAFAGTMMTINLKSATNATTGAVTGAAAFVLQDPTPQAADNGLMNNTEFIEYLVNYLQRGVALQEVDALKNVNRASWRTYSNQGAGITAAPGNIAFAANNEIIINAQLIKDLKNQTIVNAATDGVKLTLSKSNFAIAKDVRIKSVTTGTGFETYEFETIEESPVSYKINMQNTVAFGTDPEKLIPGINKVSTDKTLKPKAATVANAVVIVSKNESQNVSVTFGSASTGISAIYVNAGTTLKVNAACDALVVAKGTDADNRAVIVMGTNGSLTNENNIYNFANITNTNVRPVAGKVSDNTKVVAAPSVWPTAAIPANTQINTLVVNPATGNTVLAIDQAQIDMLANLNKKVEVVLGDHVGQISSAANVDLNNVKAISAPATIYWNTTASTTITVDAKGADVNYITGGANVTITNVAE